MGNIRSQERGRPVGRLIVAISGLPGSGKTTLARALAKSLDATLLSFGDYVRSLAAAEGAGVDRASLQEIGEREVASGAGVFVAGAMSSVSPGWTTLVVDGIRHQSVLSELRSLSASAEITFRLVHLTASEQDRLHRLGERGENTEVSRVAMHHRVEKDAFQVLLSEADIIIDTSIVAEDALNVLITSLSGCGLETPR